MIILFCGSRIWGKNSWTVLDWLHLWNNIQILAEGVTGITSNMVHLHSYELMLAICWEFIWGFQVPARDISRQQSQNGWTSYMLIGFPQSKCPMKIKQRLHSLEFCLDLPVIEGDVLKCLSIIISLGISLCSLSNLENFSHYIFIFFSVSTFSLLILRLKFLKVRPLDIVSQAMKLSSFYGSLFLSLF